MFGCSHNNQDIIDGSKNSVTNIDKKALIEQAATSVAACILHNTHYHISLPKKTKIMANIEQKATVDIEVNSKSAQHKLAELSNRLDDLNKKRAEFEKVRDYKGMERIDTEIKKVERSMNRVRTNAQKAEAAMSKLNKATPKELRLALKQLQNDLEHIERGSDAWEKHVAAIKRVKAEIKAVDAEMKEHKSVLDRLKGSFTNWGMSMAGAVASFTGLKMAASQAVEAFAEMEAEMANVRKYTGMTAEEVERLNEAFKGMDTRTSREDLNKLAQEAGRLGLQNEKDVLGFVKAADVINVALDDLGEGATLTLSKLTDIFGDKQALGVEQSLLSVGSVINELSQNCTASAPYLANFAQRLAGVGKQAGMTIPQIMGFAAVLDSQGQAVEMSATALSQLIMKLFQDPAKIAKATGMELSKFTATLKKDTNEALIMLLEQLNKLGNLDVLAPVFQSMGTDGARASQVIAALAGNVDMVRQQQLAANQAYKEGTSVTKEFEVQNSTVQARLDKAKKGFKEITIELGQKLAPAMKYAISGTSSFLRVISSLITFLVSYKWAIAALVVAIVSYKIAASAAAIATKTHAAAQVIAKGATIALTAVTQLAYATMALFSGNVKKAAMEMRIFSAVINASPVGLLVTSITAAVAGFALLVKSYGDNTRAATEAAKKHREYLRSLKDVEEGSNKFSENEVANLRSLYAAATNENMARNKRIEAAKEMNRLYPTVFSNFSSEEVMAGKAKNAYDNLTDSIIRNARARAAAEKIMENEKAILELEEEKNRLRKENKEARDVVVSAAERRRQAAGRDDSRRSVWQEGLNLDQGIQDLDRTIRENTETITGNVKAIHEIDKKIEDRRGANQWLQSEYNVTGASAPSPVSPPQISYTAPMSEKERKAREKAAKAAAAEEKKRQAEEAKQARIAAALAKKEFKDAKEAVEKNLSDQNSDALEEYNNGLIDYVTYLEKKHKAAQEYYEAAEEVYKKFGAEESEDAAKLREKSAEEEKKFKETMLKLKKERLADDRDQAKNAANIEYYNPDNKAAYHNKRVLDNELAKIDIEYLTKVRDLEQEGSEARYKAQRDLDKATKAEELRQRKQMEEDMTAWLYIYSQKGAKDRMDAELTVVDELLNQEKIKTEEAEEAKAAIRRKYRDEVNSKTGTKAPNQDFTDAAENRDKQMAALEDAYSQGLVGEEEYQSRRWQIIQNYHNKIAELVKGEGSTWATLITGLVETWEAGFDHLGETIPEKLKTIGDMAAAAFAVMNEGISSYTNYVNASRDLEVAKVTESYDKQIKAAGNNERKTKKLEEKKQKEIAAIKNKYNKRAQKVEIAQAIASTALAAINSYASAAKVNWILGAVAAAMAVAAGAIQIAAIQKQHQAEAAGYYEGGFTRRDRDHHREVGVVHANEFVANHEAVANPHLAPVLRMIDAAQRNNTVGSLSADDVSRAIGQGRILGQTVAAQQQMVAHGDQGLAVVAASVQEQTDAIAHLQQAIDDGIEAYVVMDGERGLDKQYKRYQRLINNPKR